MILIACAVALGFVCGVLSVMVLIAWVGTLD
jgi:uncharacterized membrane protein